MAYSKGSVNTCWINSFSCLSVLMVWFISSILGRKGSLAFLCTHTFLLLLTCKFRLKVIESFGHSVLSYLWKWIWRLRRILPFCVQDHGSNVRTALDRPDYIPPSEQFWKPSAREKETKLFIRNFMFPIMVGKFSFMIINVMRMIMMIFWRNIISFQYYVL